MAGLTLEDQLELLKQIPEAQIALMPPYIREIYYRQKELEEIGAVGGYYEEPTEFKHPILPKKKKK